MLIQTIRAFLWSIAFGLGVFNWGTIERPLDPLAAWCTIICVVLVLSVVGTGLMDERRAEENRQKWEESGL